MEKRPHTPTVYLVIPCYNEEEVLPITADCLQTYFLRMISDGIISQHSKIMFVDDGSLDTTWAFIKRLFSENPMFSGIRLSKNVGHQFALLAGLLEAMPYADAVISMDADLQDDICAIEQMLQQYQCGCEIVYGVRKKRDKDTIFKRGSAKIYYRILHFFGARTISNHADYRLMSKRALQELAKYQEVNLFLRGIIPLIGFKSSIVYYDRGERAAGESKYSLSKMTALALEGITSFSTKLLRIITLLGVFVFLISIIMLIYTFVRYFLGYTIVGWTSMMISIWAIGGLLLISLGIIGEYIGKIYLEIKRRPRYVIDEFLHEGSANRDEKI